MPTVIVEAIEGRSIEQKRGLVEGITEVVVKNFNVEAERVMVIIHELKLENVAKTGKLFTDSH